MNSVNLKQYKKCQDRIGKKIDKKRKRFLLIGRDPLHPIICIVNKNNVKRRHCIYKKPKRRSLLATRRIDGNLIKNTKSLKRKQTTSFIDNIRLLKSVFNNLT